MFGKKPKDYTLVSVSKDTTSILNYVRSAMRDQGYTSDEISTYITEATQIDYDHLVSLSVEKLHEINQKRREEEKKNG